MVEEQTFKISLSIQSLTKNMRVQIILNDSQQNQPTIPLYFKKYFVQDKNKKNIYRQSYLELQGLGDPQDISLFLTDSEQDQSKDNKTFTQYFSYQVSQIKEIRLLSPIGTYPFFKKMYEDSLDLKTTLNGMQQRIISLEKTVVSLEKTIKKLKKKENLNSSSINNKSSRQIEFSD